MTHLELTYTDEFIVLDVQENKLWPEMSLLSSFDDLGNVDAGDEEFKMVHDYEDY